MLNITIKEKPSFKKKRDNYSRRLKTKKLINYLQSELRSSTTHGLPYIAKKEIHWFERIFWAISFLISCAIVFVLLSTQYTRLMETPIVMSVEKDYFDWNVSYPCVVLCPVNKLNDEIFADYVNETLNRTGYNLESYYASIVSVSLEALNVLDLPSADILKLINPKDYAEIAMDLFKRLDNSTVSNSINWPVSVEPAMTELGMCHIINSNVAVFDDPTKWSDKDVITYSKTNIELSVHDTDFFVQILNYADAFKIYTVSPDEVIINGASLITFDTEGFLSYGVQMSTTRASKDIKYIPLHLRKCRFTYESDSQRYQIYSYNRCLLECRIKMILKLCNCIPHFYKPLDNERICSLAELECVLEYKKEIVTLSVTNATMRAFENVEGLPLSSRDCGCLGNCEEDFYRTDFATFFPQSSMNRLRVSVSAFPKVRVRREIIFSFYDIFLRSGGIVNLCIGASAISIMELLMTALRIPIYEIMQIAKGIWRRYKHSVKKVPAPIKMSINKKQC